MVGRSRDPDHPALNLALRPSGAVEFEFRFAERVGVKIGGSTSSLAIGTEAAVWPVTTPPKRGIS
jgi:hypothetical protein